MFCYQCGTKLEGAIKFCPECGAPVLGEIRQQPVPQQQSSLPTPKMPPRPAYAPPAEQQKTAQSPAALVQAQNRPPVSAAAPAYAVKTEKKRWPVPAWLFCLFAALAAAAGTYYAIVVNAMLFYRETFMSALFGRANYRAAIYLEVFLGVFPYLLAAVLFLIHTKRKSPWVTALPWTLLLLIFSVEKFGMIFMERSVLPHETGDEVLVNVVSLLIITLLWWLIVTIRPNGIALKIVFLILSILLTGFWLVLKLFEMPGFSVFFRYAGNYAGNLYFGSMFLAVANLLMAIGYGIAGFSVRKKAKGSGAEG